MKRRVLLEISVESSGAAEAAVRGGADRIELCENLAVGGVTPSERMMRDARQRIAVPIFAMIRPRGGNFVYTAAEFAEMQQGIEWARNAGMDGVVLGILTPDGRVDVARTSELVALAKRMEATFHRAFDELQDLERGLEDVIATGATRILTSGGKATAEEGYETLGRLQQQARRRAIILPGGGIRAGNLSRIARGTQATEMHSGLSHLLTAKSTEPLESAVREMARMLEDQARELAARPR